MNDTDDGTEFYKVVHEFINITYINRATTIFTEFWIKSSLVVWQNKQKLCEEGKHIVRMCVLKV